MSNSTSITAICSSIPNCLTSTTSRAIIDGAAVVYLNSICDEMPTMSDCRTCTVPASLTSCPTALKVYSDLCLDMPRMTQCVDYTSLCAENATICAAIRNGASTDSPSTDKKSDGKVTFSNVVFGIWVIASLVATVSL
jgi:hypothetical protein